ncbi:hypothetical protein SKAU_G00084440 [Synaphobranchus kaupii]|uniref:Uncharacterized protein n=1 Tax=Synaphobranchus kaupii TaxID=118154 RepID=A0A9Q1J5U5_SYNKA|nr:hypothetical protein SKAU_G00084440 [Synaphobranchus kaupii]
MTVRGEAVRVDGEHELHRRGHARAGGARACGAAAGPNARLRDLFPLLTEDLEIINGKRPEKKRLGSLADLDVHCLPRELQVQIKTLASGLNAMFEFTNSKTRRKNALNKASIVFIDRTLDLTGAVGHHGDSLVEKILSVLPPLPGHRCDVQVDMLELTDLPHTPETQDTLAPRLPGATPGHGSAGASGRPC